MADNEQSKHSGNTQMVPVAVWPVSGYNRWANRTQLEEPGQTAPSLDA